MESTVVVYSTMNTIILSFTFNMAIVGVVEHTPSALFAMVCRERAGMHGRMVGGW